MDDYQVECRIGVWPRKITTRRLWPWLSCKQTRVIWFQPSEATPNVIRGIVAPQSAILSISSVQMFAKSHHSRFICLYMLFQTFSGPLTAGAPLIRPNKGEHQTEVILTEPLIAWLMTSPHTKSSAHRRPQHPAFHCRGVCHPFRFAL